MTTDIVLASASPRRKQLLEQLGCTVHQQAADIDESVRPDETGHDYVMRMAKEKAQVIVERRPSPYAVLAADTVISLDGALIGKPADYLDACHIWRQLAGRQHQVLTGVALYYRQQSFFALSRSDVQFATLTEQQMQAYWHSGEPQDKAGAYAIQGIAAQWIAEIRGSYSGIMGLPLFETAQLLRKAGVRTDYE